MRTIILAVAVFALISVNAQAQSQARAMKAKFEADIARHEKLMENLKRIEAATPKISPYRLVTNQLFDTSKSKLWHDYTIKVKRTDTNGVVGTPYVFRELVNGIHDYNQKDWGSPALVLNYGRAATTSEEITIRAMLVGTTNIYGGTLEVLDCGTTNKPAKP